MTMEQLAERVRAQHLRGDEAMTMEQLVERLRASGMAPRFAAPVDTEPPPQLKSPTPVTRQVGSRRIEVNNKGGGARV
jgi:hypothetical protein